jgi:endoglucanase
MDLKREIMVLSALHGVSGGEGEIAEYLAERLKPLTDTVKIDRFGNVLGYKKASRREMPTLMLDAHIDQVGFMVTEVTDSGFARFTSIGADPRVLLSDEMTILSQNGIVKGVVSVLPPHLQNAGDELKPVAVRDMSLDLEINGKRAKESVKPGDLVTFDVQPVELLNDSIAGVAMDNRGGVAALLYAMTLMSDFEPACNLIVAGTTREESGFYGAIQCVLEERPEYIVVIDACQARTGDSGPYERVHEQGAGPVIGRGANSSPRLAEKLLEAAVREGLNYQLEAFPRTSRTNAWASQIAAQGAVTAVVSFPVKYMHTPVEMLDVKDVAALGKLLCAFCRNFEGLNTEMTG